MNDHLIRSLHEAGAATQVVRLDNGSDVLLLPQGGRVLGLFTPQGTHNFFWTNPIFDDAAKARVFLNSDEWQNTGGERTWLAPELDFFFPNYPDLGVYRQPRQFDAQPFHVAGIPGAASMRTEFQIKHARQGSPIGLRLEKSISAAANPLRHEAAWKHLKDVAFAGYELCTRLEFATVPVPGVLVGLWHLIQMPHGGDLLLPGYGGAKPKIVFGEIPLGDLTGLPAGGVRYRMRARGEQKISVRATACTGRGAYVYAAAGQWHIVLRNFFVNPSGEYVDVPWSEPADRGYGVQACNVNSGLGSFSEFEYHTPAIGVPGAAPHSEDVAQVWAYTGTRAEIALIAHELLGIAIGDAS